MPGENDLWLTRWNTLRNYLEDQLNTDGLDDPEYGTIRGILNVMDQVEEMEE